jgi:hypothetical protein
MNKTGTKGPGPNKGAKAPNKQKELEDFEQELDILDSYIEAYDMYLKGHRSDGSNVLDKHRQAVNNTKAYLVLLDTENMSLIARSLKIAVNSFENLANIVGPNDDIIGELKTNVVKLLRNFDQMNQ